MMCCYVHNIQAKRWAGAVGRPEVQKFAGAKKFLLPITSVSQLGTVPSNLICAFSLIFYSTAQETVFKALGVE
jgi:predicted ATP-dependent Lon-type protease